MGGVQAHVHKAIERNIVGTSEVLVVKKGRCEIDVYTDNHELVETQRARRVGDFFLCGLCGSSEAGERQGIWDKKMVSRWCGGMVKSGF